MKKAVLTILILCAAVGAQSPLTLKYPLGLPDLAVTGASAALGGGGAAVAEEYIGTGLNPANAAIGERAAFSALVSYDLTNVADNGASSTVSGYAPKLLSLAIPLGRAGNMAFSMQKRCEAGLIYNTKVIWEDSDELYKSGSIELHRNGGLTAWQAGWAYRFSNGLSLGLAYERLFFNMDSRDIFESTVRHYQNSASTSNVTETVKEDFASSGIRFGMQVPVNAKVILGAAAEYVLPGSENGTRTREYYWRETSASAAAIDEKTSGEFSVNLPPSINIGAAYKPDDRWLFTADANSTLWEFYENSLDGSGAQRTFGISAGARLIPAAGLLSSGYWEKIHYSAGLRYATLPHSGDGAHEYSLAIGAGLPIPNEGGIIDIVLNFGQRTDARYAGYAENIIKFQIGINGGRSWFQKDASRDY